MITIEDDGYLEISLLLLKGGGMVSEKVLYREVSKSRDSIDKSLGKFEKKLKHQFNGKQKKVLYPTGGSTNIKDWDIQMLTGVLLTVFKKGLKEEEKEAIGNIKSVRNEIFAHISLKPFAHSTYEEVRKELITALELLSSKLDNPIPRKCKKLIKKCTESRLDKVTVDKLLEGINVTEELWNEITKRLDRTSNEPGQNIDGQHEKTRKVPETELTLKGDKGQHERVDEAVKTKIKEVNAAIDKAGNTDPSVQQVVEDMIKDNTCIREMLSVGSIGGATNKVSGTVFSPPSVYVEQDENELMSKREKAHEDSQVIGKTEIHYLLETKEESDKANEENVENRNIIADEIRMEGEQSNQEIFSGEKADEFIRVPRETETRHHFGDKIKGCPSVYPDKGNKEMYTENETSIHVRHGSHDAKRFVSDLDVEPSFGSQETEEDTSGNQSFQINTKVWERCINSKEIQEVDCLLNKRILPDQDLLDRAAYLFGMSSITVKNICHSVCLYLKANVQQIVSVYPAIDCRQKSTSNNITFVIFTAHPSIIGINEYRCYPRCLHEKQSSPSDENLVIKELEEDCQKDWSEAEKIQEILNKHSKALMEQHTYITRISISWVKSKGYGTENHSKEPKTCIAVNVLVKGLVPINEDVLPKTLDGIDVDVREGVVLSYGLGPNEHHENLKMGCAVYSGSTNAGGEMFGGTLGGFFEIEGELYCISCAHNFLSSDDMEKMKNCEECILGNKIGKFEAHQPVVRGSQAFGVGVRAVYNEGGKGASGVDAVIIKMEKRLPISGEFPECPYKRNAGVKHQTFSSGKMYTRDEVKRLIRSKKLTVVKFGCSSGWTRGVLRFDGASVRLNNLIVPQNGFGMLLYNQIEIESIGNTCFATYGDSGALVFTDENDQLSVIGIVEGGMSGTVLITPIFEVFAALGLPDVRNMKKFFPMQNENVPIQDVDQVSSHYLPSSSDSEVAPNLENSLKNLEKKINALEQNIPQEIANHVQEFGNNVQTSIHREMSQVKVELKNEIDTSNTEVKNLIQHQTEMFSNILATLGYEDQCQNTANTSLSQTSKLSSSDTDHTHFQSQN